MPDADIEEKKSQESSSNETTVNIQLGNYSDSARLHIFGMQFMPVDSESLFKELAKFVKSEDAQGIFDKSKWTNQFDNEKRIGDEIQYVFARRQRKNLMGN